jgi:hypothetical protein
MKLEKTYVESAKFENIVKALDLDIVIKAAWVKVAGPKGRFVILPKTASVGRCDLSGFTVEMDGVKAHSSGTFGSVEQELEFEGRTEEQVLETFRAVCEHMTTLAPRELVRRRRGKTGAGTPASWVAASSPAKQDDSSPDSLPAAE